jgi:hypothetical protein
MLGRANRWALERLPPQYHDLFGLVVGVLLIGIPFALAMLFIVPTSLQTPVYGRVLAFSSVPTETGDYTRLRVEVEDRVVSVPLRRGRICRVGDRIELLKGRSAFGVTYRAAIGGCSR